MIEPNIPTCASFVCVCVCFDYFSWKCLQIFLLTWAITFSVRYMLFYIRRNEIVVFYVKFRVAQLAQVRHDNLGRCAHA